VFTAPIFPGFCVCHTDSGGGGGPGVARWDGPAKQSECLFTAKTQMSIPRLSASQASKHFLLEIKDVAFCLKIFFLMYKKNQISFNQVMTYLMKYDFAILAEV
jgi:hypothetical protein